MAIERSPERLSHADYLALPEGRYDLIEAPDALTTPLLPGFALPLDALFAPEL